MAVVAAATTTGWAILVRVFGSTVDAPMIAVMVVAAIAGYNKEQEEIEEEEEEERGGKSKGR